MSEKFVITKELIEKAKAYMPIKEKQELAEMIADMSTVCIKTAEQNAIGNGILALPPQKAEDGVTKRKCLLNVFLSFYFNIEIEKVTDELYDYFGESQIFNQLERMKGCAEIKDKVFDILTDYREFKGMVDAQIFANIRNANDTPARILAGIAVTLTPEKVKELTEMIKKEKDTLNADKKEEVMADA